MSKLVITTLDRENDQFVGQTGADVEAIKRFFDYIVGMSECVSKLMNRDRIFNANDAEEMTILAMMLIDDCYNTITREIKCLSYAIRMCCSLARDIITAEPDRNYKPSIMLDPRDTIDYDAAFKNWRVNNNVRAGEMFLICGFLNDVGRHYQREGKVVEA